MSDSNTKPEREGGFSLSEWFGGIRGEFRRVTWPSRNEVIKMTITVIVTSGIVGAIIVGYDAILSFLYGLVF